MSSPPEINIDRVRRALSYLQLQSAQNNGVSISPSDINSLLQAIEVSQTSRPLLKDYSNDINYEAWWKKTLEENDPRFKSDSIGVEQAWKEHKNLLNENDEQTKKHLFSFASTLNTYSSISSGVLEKSKAAFDNRGYFFLVISSVNSLIGITLQSLLLHNSTPDNNIATYSSIASNASLVLSSFIETLKNPQEFLQSISTALTKIDFDSLKKGGAKSFSTLGSIANSSLNLTSAASKTAGTTISNVFTVSTTSASLATINTLPFLGLSILLTGVYLNERNLEETKEKILATKDKITELERALDNPSVTQSLEQRTSTQQELFKAESELLSLNTMRSQQAWDNRITNSLYIALAVTSIGLTLAAASAASVATVGAFPAAIAIGFGIAYFGLGIASTVQSHLRNNNEKQEKLSLQHEQLLRNTLSLTDKAAFNFEKMLVDGSHSISVNSYIKTLIKNSPDKAQKLLDQLNNIVKATEHFEQQIEPGSIAHLLAEKQLQLEKKALQVMLSNLSPPPSKHISASLIFESANIKNEKEEKINIIERHVQDIEQQIGTKLFQAPNTDKNVSITFNSVQELLTNKTEQAKPLKNILKQIVTTKIALDKIPSHELIILNGYNNNLLNLIDTFKNALIDKPSKQIINEVSNKTSNETIRTDYRFHKIFDRLNESTAISSKSSIKILELLGMPGKIDHPQDTAQEHESFNKNMTTRTLNLDSNIDDVKDDPFAITDDEDEDLGSRISMTFGR